MKSRYMLPPDLVYMNNGSFGPAPRVVYDALLVYLKQLEENPAVFNDQYNRAVKVVKPKLASFVGGNPDYMGFVPNLTYGMNVFSRGIRGLSRGDEVLTTDQEYGAVRNMWDYAAKMQGFVIKDVAIPVPPKNPEEIVKVIEQGITPRTRVILASHITTTTGLVLPVKDISALAHSRGILSVIDGAHAPGMIRVNIADIGCDFYTGNCHKWLGAPLGTAFISVHPRSWERLEPFLVGWGWHKDRKETFEGNFENPGVHNTALPNAVGEAVDFQLEIGTKAIEDRGRQLAEYGKDLFTRMPGREASHAAGSHDVRLHGQVHASSPGRGEADERRLQEAQHGGGRLGERLRREHAHLHPHLQHRGGPPPRGRGAAGGLRL